MQGRELWVMVVSASPYEHMIGKPNVKYVANMHGELLNLFHPYSRQERRVLTPRRREGR